ncbi:hypothetical protein C8J56DRAFT_921608 [Mycena floridula]|nr:hypothetical protein C8J56DRAFT_921608 [Mycena floridula]
MSYDEKYLNKLDADKLLRLVMDTPRIRTTDLFQTEAIRWIRQFEKYRDDLSAILTTGQHAALLNPNGRNPEDLFLRDLIQLARKVPEGRHLSELHNDADRAVVAIEAVRDHLIYVLKSPVANFDAAEQVGPPNPAKEQQLCWEEFKAILDQFHGPECCSEGRCASSIDDLVHCFNWQEALDLLRRKGQDKKTNHRPGFKSTKMEDFEANLDLRQSGGVRRMKTDSESKPSRCQQPAKRFVDLMLRYRLGPAPSEAAVSSGERQGVLEGPGAHVAQIYQDFPV